MLARIPPGKVCTYGDLARFAGQPGAARAVGNLMSRATEPGLPYHRVVASAGLIGGFGGAPHIKRARLAAEGHSFRGQRLAGFRIHRWTGPKGRRE